MHNKERNKILFNILGFFLIIFGLFAMSFSIYNGTPELVIWICYIGMILIGIGIFIKDGELIASQLNILTIPLLLWTFDFIYTIFAGNNILGMAEYFFDPRPIFAQIISLEHLFLLPLAFFALYIIGLKNKGSWKISFFQITIIFIVMNFFNITEHNVNCISYPCWNFPMLSPYYFWWFVISFSGILITCFAINRIFIKKL